MRGSGEKKNAAGLLALAFFLIAAHPAAAQLRDPVRLAFEGEGMQWPVNSSGSRVASPAWSRLTFEFTASSEEPCAEVRKALLLESAATGKPLAPALYIPAGAPDAWGHVDARGGTAYVVRMRAMVRLPVHGEPPGVSSWAVAKTAVLYAGVAAAGLP